jgi:hypothetical protein
VILRKEEGRSVNGLSTGGDRSTRVIKLATKDPADDARAPTSPAADGALVTPLLQTTPAPLGKKAKGEASILSPRKKDSPDSDC